MPQRGHRGAKVDTATPIPRREGGAATPMPQRRCRDAKADTATPASQRGGWNRTHQRARPPSPRHGATVRQPPAQSPHCLDCRANAAVSRVRSGNYRAARARRGNHVAPSCRCRGLVTSAVSHSRATVSPTPRCGDLVPCEIATSASCHFRLPPRNQLFATVVANPPPRIAVGVLRMRLSQSLAANTLSQPRAAVNPPL